jgi:hypothetical protein
VYFVTIASSIKRLKFSREVTDEWWYDYEKDALSMFVNVEEIHAVCLDGFWNWEDEVFNFHWPYLYGNQVFIDPLYLGILKKSDISR